MRPRPAAQVLAVITCCAAATGYRSPVLRVDEDDARDDAENV